MGTISYSCTVLILNHPGQEARQRASLLHGAQKGEGWFQNEQQLRIRHEDFLYLAPGTSFCQVQLREEGTQQLTVGVQRQRGRV